MRRQRGRWAALVALAAVATTVSAASIRDLEAGGLGGIAAAGPEFVSRRAWIDDYLGNGDGVANRGERTVLFISLRNVGFADALNTRLTLHTDDPEVDLTAPTWRRGVWRVDKTWSSQWTITIDANASPHDVTLVANVTADNGSPWSFIITFPIVDPPVDFARPYGWIDDPAPDGDGDGKAEPGERLVIGWRLQHIGTADASNVRVTLRSLDPSVSVLVGAATHPTWLAGEERDTLFVVDVAQTAATGSVLVFVTLEVEGEDPWQFSMPIPIVGKDPAFEFRSFWLFDPEPGGNRDGLATPGERLLPRIRLQNAGEGGAEDVQVTLSSLDGSVSIAKGSVSHATWPAGAARNNSGFAIDISPTATPHVAILVARVSTPSGATWQFNVTFDIGQPRVEFSHVRSWISDPTPRGNRDGVANPGERVRPTVRVRQVGPSPASNVRVTFAIDDPDVNVVHTERSYDVWSAGSAITLNRFAVNISPDATPHDVTAIVRVFADEGGPWEFLYVFPIAYRPVEFVQRSSWVFDPTPGGDRDGELEAGERAFPRFRLRQVGREDAAGVTVRLTTADPDVTIVAGEVTHGTWAAGVARNNVGFVVDISPFATPHDVEFVVTTDAAGDIQQFPYTVAIVGPLAKIVVAEASLADTKGDRNGVMEPGEYITVRVRLVNIGSTAITGLRGALVAPGDDIVLLSGTTDIGDLASGESVRDSSMRARIRAWVTPRDTAVVVLFTADNAESARVELPIAMGSDIGMAVVEVRYDDAEGGNGDGVPNPGETARLVMRLSHKKGGVKYSV